MRFDDLWLSMKQGENTLDRFRGALKAWKDLHLKAIGLYGKGDS